MQSLRKWYATMVMLLALASTAAAEQGRPLHLRLPLPAPGNDVVGQLSTVVADRDTTLIDLGVRHGYGYEELRAANPAVDAWLVKKGTSVRLPSRFILPQAPREGIVINTAEMRLYYFPKPVAGSAGYVEVFPVSIGRGEWNTPLVSTRVSAKQKDPAWYPPESIRREHAADGRPLGKYVAPGPDNPLGRHLLRLSIPSYLIHGSNKEYGIGMQVTHGCMRLYAQDIEHLYNTVPVNTPVRIVYQPYKMGWQDGQLFLEVHPPLDGLTEQQINDLSPLVDTMTQVLKTVPDYAVDGAAIQLVRAEANGLPEPVGPRPISALMADNGDSSLATLEAQDRIVAPGSVDASEAIDARGSIDAMGPAGNRRPADAKASNAEVSTLNRIE